MGLHFAGSLHEDLERLRAGKTTSAELTEDALARAHDAQDRLNAFRVVLDDRARAAAAEADRRREGGREAPLLGVPVVIKDDADLEGEETRFGCPGPLPPATADAEVVRRVRKAGAVVVGKTNTPEVGLWPITEGEAFGVTRSPWNPGRTPGGSSGGTAAAVAAGVVAAGIGSDGAGSVRIPASWSNLVGIKPRRGRVSSWPDAESFTGLATHGPLARTTADAALLLDVMSGGHPGDRHHAPRLTQSFADAAATDPGPLRIGLALDPPWVGVPNRLDEGVRERIAALAVTLGELGHEVVAREIPWGPVGPLFMPRSMVGVRRVVRSAHEPSGLDARTRSAARMGALLGPALGLVRALERPLAARITSAFRGLDVLLTPTTARPPLPVGAIDGLGDLETDRVVAGACPYTFPWNVLGLPAVSVPAGFVADGLPVGAQLLGKGEHELLLVSLAGQLERHLDWAAHRPPDAAAHAARAGAAA